MRKDTGPGWNRSAYSRRSIGQERHLFWLLAALSLAGYALLGWWMPLVPNVPRTPEGLPLPDISSFAPWPWGTLAYGLLLAALFGLYWLAYRAIQAVTPARPAQDATPEFQNLPQPLPLRYLLSKADRLRRDSLVQILAPVVLFGVVLVGTFPFNATDIFRYWITTRITAAPALNPYEVAVEDLGDPRLTSLAGEWASETSPYGPVWELVAAGVTQSLRYFQITGSSMVPGLLALKALGLILHLATTVVLWQLLRGRPPPTRAGRTLLWAWNPALLLSFVASGHNDILMLFWLLLGLLALEKGRPTLGLLTMALAPLTKLSGLLPIPFFALATFLSLPSQRERARVGLATGIGWAALIVMAFLPFGTPLTPVERLLSEASEGGGFSLLALAILFVRQVNPGFSVGPFLVLGTSLFVLIALLLLYLTWRGRSAFKAAADVYAAYLLLAFRFRIWYASWMFPWLLLEPERLQKTTGLRDHPSFRLQAGLWFLVTTQFSVLIYGPLPAGSQFRAHLLGVPFTFGLPLLLAWLGSRRH